MDLSDHTDHRKWTQQHLDAADLRIASIAPTPPQGEIENDCMDVNVRGPGMYNYNNDEYFDTTIWSRSLYILYQIYMCTV